MEQLNKVIQDNKFLKEAYEKKAPQNQVLDAKSAQQNQALVNEAKTPTGDSGEKPSKAEKNPSKSNHLMAINKSS